MKYLLAVGLIAFATTAGALELSDDQKRAITADFSDPDSALFRDIRQSDRHEHVICGEVNGKNRYGGYVGYRKFWMDADLNEAFIEPDNGFILGAGSAGCA